MLAPKYRFEIKPEVFQIRYKIKPDPTDSKRYKCVIFGLVREENTNCNEELVVILSVTHHSTIQKCQTWADRCNEELRKWYLRWTVRGFLSKNLNPDTLNLLEQELKRSLN